MSADGPTNNEAQQLANQSRALMNELMSNISDTITTRSQLFRQMLDPRRDLNAECGYPDEISLADFRQMYDREGIGQRVVTVWPEECWIQDPEIKENDETDETDFELAWKSLEERYNLYHYCQRVDELSGVGTFGLLLLGFNDAQPLDKAVPGIVLTGPKTGQRAETKTVPGPTDRKTQLMFVRAFDETSCKVTELDKDPKSPRFGRPVMYTINLADPNVLQGVDQPGSDTKVHWTRVVHVADNRRSSEVYGTPRQKAVWNRLLDLRKLLGGSAEMFWKGAFPGYSFETQPELGDVTVDVDSLRDEFAEFANGLNRYLATSGINVKSLAPQVASPEAHVIIQIKMVAMTIRVPWRVLLGSEQAQLASEQDRASFNKRICNRRTKYITPWILRSLIDRLILVGVLPEPVGDATNQADGGEVHSEMGSFAYSVEWPDVEETSAKESADVAKIIIEVIARYIQSGAVQVLPEKVLLTRILDFTPEEADAILEEAAKRIEEMNDEVGLGLEDDEENTPLGVEQGDDEEEDEEDEEEDDEEEDEPPKGKSKAKPKAAPPAKDE